MQRFDLSLPARPFQAWQAGPDSWWLACSEPGALSVLYHLGSGGAEAVELPRGTLFWSMEGDGLVLISAHEVVDYSFDAGGLRPRRRVALVPGLASVHPPYYLPRVEKRLVLFDNRRLYLISAEGSSQSLTLPEQARTELDGDQPRVFAQDGTLYWSDQEHLFLVRKGDIEVLPVPETRDMESAAVLDLEKGVPTWLRYGGKSGDLGSFGWQLLCGGNTQISGEGIMARFGRDLHGSRLWVLTVPSSIGGQLWQALRGYTAFTLSVAQLRNGSWRETGRSFEVKLKENEHRERPYLLSFDCDYNGDGMGDLIAADDKRGVRLFASRPDGSIEPKAQKLADNPDALLILPDHLFLCERKRNGWGLTVRRRP